MEDSRKGEGDDEREVECQVHTWMIKKAKKPWYIRRGKTGEKGTGTEKRKIRSLGHVRGDLLLHSMLVSLILLHLNPIFLPKIRLAFFPASINSLFGLRGPRSIPVLDSSQIWSLQQ